MVLKSRMMRQAVYGTMKNAYKILIEKSEGMWPLGRPESRYGTNVEMGLKRKYNVLWIHLVQNRLELCDSIYNLTNLRFQ
jgi:hypothetical protein